jgi:hypothetical protein
MRTGRPKGGGPSPGSFKKGGGRQPQRPAQGRPGASVARSRELRHRGASGARPDHGCNAPPRSEMTPGPLLKGLSGEGLRRGHGYIRNGGDDVTKAIIVELGRQIRELLQTNVFLRGGCHGVQHLAGRPGSACRCHSASAESASCYLPAYATIGPAHQRPVGPNS